MAKGFGLLQMFKDLRTYFAEARRRFEVLHRDHAPLTEGIVPTKTESARYMIEALAM